MTTRTLFINDEYVGKIDLDASNAEAVLARAMSRAAPERVTNDKTWDGYERYVVHVGPAISAICSQDGCLNDAHIGGTLCIEHLVSAIETALGSTHVEVGVRADARDAQRCTVDDRYWDDDAELIETMDLADALAEDDVEDGTEMDLYYYSQHELEGTAALRLHDGTCTVSINS